MVLARREAHKEVAGNGALASPLATCFDHFIDAFHEPARFVAKAMTDAGISSWLYRFTYVRNAESDQKPNGAAHADDVPYLFQTLDPVFGKDNVKDEDRDMACAFSTYLANFAKGSDPDTGVLAKCRAALPKWPKFDLNAEKNFLLMDFTQRSSPRI